MYNSWSSDGEMVSMTRAHHTGQPEAPLVSHLQTKKEPQAYLQRLKEGNGTDGKCSRRIVLAVGMIRQAAISLHLLDFSATCSCSSFSVSRETRAKRLDVDSSFPRERRRSFSTPPPEPVPGMTGGPNVHKSPQIHLYRSPVSCSTKRRRSASVPDLLRRASRPGHSLESTTQQSPAKGVITQPYPPAPSLGQTQVMSCVVGWGTLTVAVHTSVQSKIFECVTDIG